MAPLPGGGWILTTPASRGIGFALTRLLLQKTSLPIVATARRDLEGTKARLLDGLNGVEKSRLLVLEVDVTREESIVSAAAQCKARFGSGDNNDNNNNNNESSSPSLLRLAFAIPGILLHPEKSPLAINYEDGLETFKINTLGPALLFKHFSQFLPTKRSPPFPTTTNPSSSSAASSEEEEEEEKEKETTGENETTLARMAVFAIMSARVGSISDNTLGGWYTYRASKAGVNQLVKGFDIFLKQKSGDKAVVVGLHPGTVKTGLSEQFWASTAKEKLFSPEYAAERLAGVVGGLNVEGRGKCWDWKGVEIPP